LIACERCDKLLSLKHSILYQSVFIAQQYVNRDIYASVCAASYLATILSFYTCKQNILLCGCQITANTSLFCGGGADPAKIFEQTGLLCRKKWVLEGMLYVP